MSAHLIPIAILLFFTAALKYPPPSHQQQHSPSSFLITLALHSENPPEHDLHYYDLITDLITPQQQYGIQQQFLIQPP